MKISKNCIALIGAVSITTVAFADPAINNKNRDNLVFIEPGVAVEFPGYKATKYFPTTCDEEKSILYFGNGINNGWHNASRSTLTLASAFKERMVNSGKQADHDNYNVASAFALSTRFPWQSTNENPQSTWQFLRDYLQKVVPEAVTLDIAQFFSRNGGSFNNMSPNEIASFETTRRDLFNAALEQSDAGQAFAPTYEIFLELGRKSTLVGHSYGTILSNISYENLDPGLQQGFGVTHAASMDNEVAGSSRFSFPNGNPPYVSIEEDMVVSLFRLGFTSNFRWNVDEFDWSDQTTGDAFGSRQPFISGHGFDDYYMKKQIVELIESGFGEK